jgi:hypothetical protein
MAQSTIPAPRGDWSEFCTAVGVDTDDAASASVVRALHGRLEHGNALLAAAVRTLTGEPEPGSEWPEPWRPRSCERCGGRLGEQNPGWVCGTCSTLPEERS